MTLAEFCRVIAEIESSNVATAWGDGGRAMGRYQVHPAWVWTYATAFKLPPADFEKWDDWVFGLVAQFFAHYSTADGPLEVAMRFHLGHLSRMSDADWDGEYAAKFVEAAVQLGIALG